jgi:hypothetical protein
MWEVKLGHWTLGPISRDKLQTNRRLRLQGILQEPAGI